MKSAVGEQRGRLIVIAILLGYFVLLTGLGGHSAWGRLGVPELSPPFLDMHVVTSGWECTHRHIAVLTGQPNPCDPRLRPFDYPRVWLAASVLGLGQGSTLALGFFAGLVFLLAAVMVVPRRARSLDAVVFGAALCSPAVMLGVERGNVDILIFTLLVLAAVAMRRGRRGPYWSSALVLFAAILKLYPIFATGLLARQTRRRSLIACGVVVAGFGVYALATLSDVRLISKLVPQRVGYSYGINLTGVWLARGVPALSGRVWDVLLAAAIIVPAVLARRWLRRRLPADEYETATRRDLDFFWAGAGVYVCTFALFRSYDYRLVFLLLTLPQLLRWTRERRALAVVTLAAVLATLWLASPWAGVPVIGSVVALGEEMTRRSELAFPAVVAAQMLAFAGLIAALVATLPHREGIRRSDLPR